MKKCLLLVVLLIFVACGGKIEPERDVQYYIDTGNQYFQAKKYEDAIEAYENALSRAEDPKIAAEIQLNIANAYFADEEYVLSIPVYELYLDLYPNATTATNAYLNIGLAHFNIRENIYRDLTDDSKALKYFEIVKQRDPNLYYKEGLDRKLITIRNELAEKEYKIARYYSRIWQDNSSILRYEYLLETYPDSSIVPLSYYRLIKLLSENNRIDEAKKYLTIFKAVNEKSEYYEDAVDALNKEVKRINKEQAKLEAEAKKASSSLKAVEEKEATIDNETKSGADIKNIGEPQ